MEQRIKALEREVELLKQIIELKDKLATQQGITVLPLYPSYPQPDVRPWWINPVTYTSDCATKVWC